MSKVQELREKYPSITQVTFDKLVNADKTPTKKYLEFLLKMWSNKTDTGCPNSTNQLVDLVRKFDEHLPYIENKDIYAKDYLRFTALKSIVERAEQVKEEKTFVKEEHANFYKETDTYIMLEPRTHKGSCRYGASTKWCTSGRSNENIFNNYTKNGLLIYVIRKTPLTNTNYNKIAIHMEYGYDACNSIFSIYSASDTSVQPNTLVINGWTEEELFELFSSYRQIFFHKKKYKKVKDEVNTFVSVVSNLNFERFVHNLAKLEHAMNDDYISNIKQKLDEFLNQLQNTTDAIRKTKD